MAKKKRYIDPVESLVESVAGFVLLIGVVVGAVMASAVYGIVMFLLWLF